MIKKISKLIIIFLCFFAFSMTSYAESESLKSIKDQLASDKANKASLIAKQKQVQEKIKKLESKITELNKVIEQSNVEIEEAKQKIVELNQEIIEKNKEIDSLLSFLQISDGENVYLEYIFEAKDFTDFIYRSAIVEQLTDYNDKLIDQMYELIEENKQLQVDLKKKIEDSEDDIDDLSKLLKESNLTIDDLSEDQQDIEADIKARQYEVELYEKLYKENNCADTDSIYYCVGVPYANGLTRPLNKASVTSNFGLRYHPTLHYYRMHNGIDLGVSTNTNVYASAAGLVYKITVRSSCGGNMVWIKHKINGKEYRTVYQHLHSVSVKVGDVVTINTVVGKSGGGESYDNCSTGPHLHFGILTGWSGSNYVNPRNYIEFPAKGSRFTTRFY